MKGWNRATVTRYAQAEKIVVTSAGLVDVEASDHRLAAAADPYKDSVRDRHQRDRQRKAVFGTGDRAGQGDQGAQRERAGDGGDGGRDGARVDPNDTSYQTLQKARAVGEVERSILLRLERERIEGALCETESVRKAAFNTSRPAMNAIMNLRFRIDPLLQGEADAAVRAEIWDRELRSVCAEIQRASDEALAQLIEQK